MFITFEGTDGSGKTTQAFMLEKYLKEQGHSVYSTREPGGTLVSEKIRNLVLDINYKISPMTEALLYAASRAEHVNEIIRPRLDQGQIVICTRFVDSSIVYQGIARGLGVEIITQINMAATNNLTPDITFLLDLPQKVGLTRKKKVSRLDRLESEAAEFHEKAYAGYKELANLFPNRIKLINAEYSQAEVHNQIRKIINSYSF